jgi:SPP1 family predicted phage head-tail adaptor
MITGKLNQRISFYRLQNVQDDAGGNYPEPVIYWENTYAHVKDKTSRRSTQAGEIVLEDGLEFTLRFRTDKTVLPDDILKYRRKAYIVRSVFPDDVYKNYLKVFAVSNGKDFDDETT